MKSLIVDIETTPSLAHVWQLFNNNISLSQLRESSYTLCWAAKWLHEKQVLFGAQWTSPTFIYDIYELLDEADVVIGFNIDHFDLPTLNKEFLLDGCGPPSPYQTIDLYKVVKKQFKFPSNKLTYVTEQLGIGKKLPHEGHELWVKTMAGDEKAQKKMEKYCKNDVSPLTEKLYYRVLPWIPNHPNRQLYTGSECVRCENGKMVKRGFHYTTTGRYQTYRCNSCAGWQRDTRRLDGVDVRTQ